MSFRLQHFSQRIIIEWNALPSSVVNAKDVNDYKSKLDSHWNLEVMYDYKLINSYVKGRVAQSVGHLTRKSGVLGLIPGLATYFRCSFRFIKKGSCQLLAKVCARSTG